jgi:CO dehydrogenase/acetyl-CoA synthase beta subunit
LALFDEQILAVRAAIARMKTAHPVFSEKRLPLQLDALLLGLPPDYDPGRKPFVVLREETFAELGHPASGSASMVLWSGQPELIRDGLITRIGPDIRESEGQSLPFGQVVLVGGSGMAERDLAGLERATDLGHALDGYMIRRVPRKLWSRVSRAAVQKGFSLELLGRALMVRYRERFPALQAVEVLFVTSSTAQVEELEKISLEAKGKSLTLRKLSRSGDGTYECEELHCDICPEKPTCDTIREVLVIRKKGKITGIRIVRGKAGQPAA